MLKIILPILVALVSHTIWAGETNVIRVALFDDAGVSGKGVPRVKKILGDTNRFSVSVVKGRDIAEGALTNFDVVMFTGGSGSQQAASLGEKGREEVRRFVREGGGYVGICAGAYLACSGFSWGVGVLNAKTISPKWARGEGKVEIEFTQQGHALTGQPTTKQEIYYENGPVIQPDDQENIPAYEPMAFFRSELARNGTPEGVMIDSPAVVRGTYGKGRVLFSSPHPEQTDGMETLLPASLRWVSGKKEETKEKEPAKER